MRTFYLTTIALLIFIVTAPINAQTWSPKVPFLPDTIGIADIEVVNENVIWAVGLGYAVNDSIFSFFTPSSTYSMVTADGGQTWAVHAVPMGGHPFVANMMALDASTAWVGGLDNAGSCKLLKTTNGGASWVDNSPPFDPVASWVDYIHAVTIAKMVVIGDPRNNEFEIYTSINGGQVWIPVPAGNIPDPLSGEFGFNNVGDGVDNIIWFGTNLGRIYRSKNVGLNWEVFTTPTQYVGFLSFADSLHGLVTDGNFSAADPVSNLYRTSDGGQTWSTITPADHAFRIQGIEYIPNSSSIIMGVTRSSLLTGPFETWLSKDDGLTWEQISTGQNINWPTFLNGHTGWAGESQQYAHPTQLFKYTGSPLDGLLSPNTLQAEITLSPNPTSDVLRIHVQVPESGDFILLLNDAQGRLVKNMTVRNSADFTEEMTIGNLPTGIYILTVTGKAGSVARKLEKQ